MGRKWVMIEESRWTWSRVELAGTLARLPGAITMENTRRLKHLVESRTVSIFHDLDAHTTYN